MEKPSIDVFTLCYNEEVLMPYFLRHYMEFCENIFIYDNFSTDNSCRIASGNKNVHIRKFDTNNQIRDDIYLEIKNNCWKESNADLVIVCDMDEFLYHRNITRFLKRFKSLGYTIARPTAFDMFSQKVPIGEGHIYKEVTIGARNMFFDKMLLFDPRKIKETNYYPGCHYAIPEGEVKLYKNDNALKLLHFKYLGIDYVMNRHLIYRNRLSNINRQNQWGKEYEKDYEEEIKSKINKHLADGELLEL
ncbi:MAG: glycosyltransferase family 2 protein [Bacteroidales bacterium]|nr:glycosyltransferase family 2 protein [Bacteroidales bacterium]